MVLDSLLGVRPSSNGCAGRMGVHFSVDSSGILKVDKAESVIEVWEEYEVEVPVDAPKEAEPAKQNATIEARDMLEDDDGADDSKVPSRHGRSCVLPADEQQHQQTDWHKFKPAVSDCVDHQPLLQDDVQGCLNIDTKVS